MPFSSSQRPWRPVQCAPSDHGFVPCLVRRRSSRHIRSSCRAAHARGDPVAGSMSLRSSITRRNRALGRFRRHSAHGARSNVHQATMPSSHALCAGEAAGIYAALAAPRTLAVTRWRVRCHSGRQNVSRRNRALGRFRRHSAHGARSNVHQATMASSHALCAGEAAGIYVALATPRTLAVTRWRVRCHSGRQYVSRRNRALGRFRRHSAHGARSNVHQATMPSSHALCAGEAAGIYVALAAHARGDTVAGSMS